MVQVFDAPEGFGAQFGRALGGGAAQGIAEGMDTREQKQKLKQEDDQIYKETGIKLHGITDPEMRKQQFSKMLQGQMDQKKNKSDKFADEESYGKVKDTFGQKFADLWKAAPVGGKTELLKHGMDAKTRGLNLEELLKGVKPEDVMDQSQPDPMAKMNQDQNITEKPKAEKKFEADLDTYLKQQDKDLLPSEKVARGKERYDTGLKQYQEAGEKLRGMTRDKERLDILEELEKSEKLPKDLERLNVDADGNLRLPFLASPEAQRFVKTLNEFSSGAKDTFGARVTNFDLTQYLKRYPTLMNSAEGRRQLIEQMKIVNQINSVYYKNLKNVYDKAGGVRKIDSDVAERFAEQLSDEKVNELTKKFSDIGQFLTKPSPSEFKGQKIRDKDTGEIFISDGENWVPAE